MKKNIVLLSIFAVLALAGCDESRKNEIKPAVKPTNDATAMAQEAWGLINQLDPLLNANQNPAEIEQTVRKPLRELTTRWRVEVKMTDAVAEGKYALCRKSLVSLDNWARAVIDKKDIQEVKKAYERDKALCKDAIENPNLGNTSPKSL